MHMANTMIRTNNESNGAMVSKKLQLATTIAAAVWPNASINPIRPSMLNHMEGVCFDLYDTTQGLARDSREGFQRGVLVAQGQIRGGRYMCIPMRGVNISLPDKMTVYATAKEVEVGYNISTGSLPFRLVLPEHEGCTFAGLRELVKDAGVTIKKQWMDQFIDTETVMEQVIHEEVSCLGKRRRYESEVNVDTLACDQLPDVLEALRHQSDAIRAGMRCVRTIIGPSETRALSEEFIASSINQLRLLYNLEQMTNGLIRVVFV